MEDILFTIILIVSIICYTVYKIDSNHVNKSYKSLAKPKKDKGTRVPPRKERE